MAMPTSRAAPENTMAHQRAACSSREGRKAMTSAPRAGRNTARVTAHSCQPLIRQLSSDSPTAPRSPSEPRDQQGQHTDAYEQVDGVALDVARLDVAKDAAQLARLPAHPVDRAVDHGPV